MDLESLSKVDLSNIYKNLKDKVNILSSPDNIDDNALFQFYNLNKPTNNKKKKKNDLLNPNDLNNLGESGNYISNQIIDIDNIVRKENTHAGLKNLGATCYMNSILQLLYMNTDFRQGIYNLSNTDSVFNQLQILFSSLQMGNQKVCDPKPFTDMINLKTNVQQDLQEFFKALITYIERVFEDSGNGTTNPVREQFRGNLNYNTRCLECNYRSVNSSYFYELEFPIPDTPTTLEECIEKYISVEVLSEGNQYLCENCKCKRDAERCLDLVKVPQILSFQLMRFIYDFEKEAKLKVLTPISFPITLSMEKYLNRYEKSMNDKGLSTSSLEVNEKQEYQLNSILIHHGKSAYEGHYVAIIRDDKTGEWWKFDDETSINLGKDIHTALQATTNKKKSKHNDDEYRELSTSKKRKNVLTSSSAYMLTYKKVGSSFISNPQIPEEIKSIVDANNRSFLEKIKIMQSEQDMINNIHESFKNEYSIVWNSITSSSEKFYFISTEWLKKWISGEIFFVHYLLQLQSTSEEQISLLEKLLNSSNDFLLELPVSHYVSNNQLSFENFHNKFICQHGKLDYMRISGIKKISSESWQYLSSKYNITPSIDENSLCKECCFTILKKGEDCYKELEKKTYLLNNIASSNSQEYYFISKEWYSLFKNKNSNELNELINESLLCEHGKLYPSKHNISIINGDSWKLLKEMYPNAIEFKVSNVSDIEKKDSSKKNRSTRLKGIRNIEDYKDDYCSECYNKLHNEIQKKNEKQNLRSNQKKQLASLYKIIPSNIETRKSYKLYCKTPKPGAYHMISLDWLIQWKNYIENLDLEITPVNNSDLICPHDKLMYNIADYMDNSENNDVFAIVSDSIWQTLIELYGGGPDINIIFNNDEILGIDICAECAQIKLLEKEQNERQFKNATLEFELIDERGTNRRLKRNRRKKKISVDGVNFDDSVKHLKLLIFQYHNICPNEQIIYYEDKLLNDQKNLTDYNVSKNGKWKLIYNDPIDVLISTDGSKDESNLGFSSTMLSTYKSHNVKLVEDDDNDEIDIIEVNEISNKKRKREGEKCM